jgi:hypothetical protein
MLTARGIEGTRVLQGLLALTKKHASETLEKACETALSHDCYRLRSIRQLLQRQTARQEPLPFLDEHPLIRPLDDYAAIVAGALHRQADRPSAGEGFRRHDWTVIPEEKISTASAHKKSPAGAGPQGSSVRSPPRSGYPSPGCTSAEPGSVSPDQPTIVPPSSPDQEHSDE